MKKGKKLCPQGVPSDCLYCIQERGKNWSVLDPKGNVIDEASGMREGMTIAEGYIAQCNAASSGYTGPRRARRRHKMGFGRSGRFRW